MSEKGETMEKEDPKPVKDEYSRLKLLLGVGNINYMCYQTLIAVIIVLLLVMIASKFYSNSKAASYEVAKGYIEELHTDNETGSKFPVISYQVDDQTYQYQCDLKATTAQPGDEVEVLYKASNPSEATTKLRLTLFSKLVWKAILYCAGVTVIFYLIFRSFRGLAFDELNRIKFNRIKRGTK